MPLPYTLVTTLGKGPPYGIKNKITLVYNRRRSYVPRGVVVVPPCLGTRRIVGRFGIVYLGRWYLGITH